MLRITFLTAVLLAASLAVAESPVAIAIHGGAGTILPEKMTAEREQAIRAALEESAHAGHEVLESGGPALDAVVAAIRILEDSPEFNAGRGAVLTNTGTVEMDASIMNGADLEAGAVASVKRIRHPIDAARLVMHDSPHVMLMGEGAMSFAEDHGLEFMDEDWFITDFRRRQLETIQADEQAGMQLSESWHSTVGAVALDAHGNLAAATSTGGMANKRWGRVGDSPIIGAGTYADNRACAISATGHGEFFIRHVAAHSICSLVRMAGMTLDEAANQVINETLKEAGADGGVIAVDPQGNVSMPFNTPGMYRASVDGDGKLQVLIYREDSEG
ncbi:MULTISPECIES: isoaspartyl peptidase/L-asparaginase family protein [unclassified Wenzhouxiangella]|uniref:isoaspartyl peptidase/L-asparaginase family protein n=1 Tax=unclassified Wenzhouxiangella TaxID=2613841 RepID=UPI000E32CCC9|nr:MULTISPECIES: isoaspartyl peptidase/L-asparaginase [unclassified Wenzhouxiangella]RFF28406.1 isoaspartyl peptidase/L-asparaginase [Wenzhouxiangella sp. 15181]RFP69923.1 isoaspartyl peptidase/L-asparaginase [Wenzhouxiangella sp. 15190]